MLNFIASNNDGGVREYDMEKYQIINYFRFPWAVNVSLLKSFPSLRSGFEFISYISTNVFTLILLSEY